MYHSYMLVCGGTDCTSSGSPKVMRALQNEIKKQGLEEEVVVIETGCYGLCASGPITVVYPDVISYSMVQPEDIPEIVAEYLLKGRVIAHLFYQETISPSDGIKALSGIDFYKEQHCIALRNCGVINPENIEEYIDTGGYQALGKVLTGMTPDDVIQTLSDADLRSCDDADFPTELKWKSCKQNDADRKYVCCNTGEDDPDAFMDRSALEGDSHALLKAMAIAGYAIGSNQGYVYVRAEYPTAMRRSKVATGQARKMEPLSKNIFEAGSDFDADTRLGAGVFACSEETALMTSIEDKRGEPRPRPLFSAQKGLLGELSILSSVETYVNVPQIIPSGSEWFASMGIEESKGTEVFVLNGKINSTGPVEVPMGVVLRTAIDKISGGVPNGKKFKATQTGGPSDGCVPAEHFDIPIDYNSLLSIDPTMGSDGLIVMDEDGCVVDIAKFSLEFTVGESCGKCTACRIGAKRILGILEGITKGTTEMIDLDKLERFCHYVEANPLCGLDQTAPNPILSTLHFFRDEYEAHIKEKRYPVGICKALLPYVIDRDKYRGYTLCTHACPADAIVKSIKNSRVIDLNKCIKCDACMEECKFGTIYKK